MSTATLAPAEAAPDTTGTAGELESVAPGTTTPPAQEAPAPATPAIAVDEGDYHEMKARLLRGEPIPELEESAPAAEVPAEPPAATAPPETPPAATEEESERTPERIRLTGLPDGHLVGMANALARKENISFTEAFERVAPKPAKVESAATAPASEQVTPQAEQIRDRGTIETDIQSARSEVLEAAKAADAMEEGANTRLASANLKLSDLKDELTTAEFREAEEEAQRETAAKSKFDQTVSASQTRAVQYWPEANDPNSELSKRTLELADAYEKDPNLAPLVLEADSPFQFVQMAAQQLGLAPVHLRPKTNGAKPTPSPSPTATKPAPVNQRAVGRPTQPAVAPASGAARTTQETQEDPLGLDKIRNPEDYKKLKSRLTGQRY